jgi:hypothetical protein
LKVIEEEQQDDAKNSMQKRRLRRYDFADDGSQDGRILHAMPSGTGTSEAAGLY